jgi:hypothetical protein
MNLAEAVNVAMSYNELDIMAKQFWDDLDHIIMKPRTDLASGLVHKIKIAGVCYSYLLII